MSERIFYYEDISGALIEALRSMPTVLIVVVVAIIVCVCVFPFLLPRRLHYRWYIDEDLLDSPTFMVSCIFSVMTVIIPISDLCLFPGGIFLDGHPYFLGGRMLILYPVVIAGCIGILSTICFAFIDNDDSLPMVGCGVWGLLWAFVPFKSSYGFLLLPIAVQVLRAILFPFSGIGLFFTIGLVAAVWKCVKEEWLPFYQCVIAWFLLSWVIAIGFSLRLVPLAWPYDKSRTATGYTTNLLVKATNKTVSSRKLHKFVQIAEQTDATTTYRASLLIACAEAAARLDSHEDSIAALREVVLTTDGIKGSVYHPAVLSKCKDVAVQLGIDPNDIGL